MDLITLTFPITGRKADGKFRAQSSRYSELVLRDNDVKKVLF